MTFSNSIKLIEPNAGQSSMERYEAFLSVATVKDLIELQKDVPSFSAMLCQDVSTEAQDKPYVVVNGVAIIPLIGDMENRPSWRSVYGQCTSSAMSRVMVALAGQDPSIKNIMIEMDSYGGDVDGVAELSETIARIRLLGKQVWAFVSPNCHSAAYWVACHCNKIILSSPNAYVGSLGIVYALCDKSEMPAMAGIKWYKLSTAPNKGVGMAYSPITAENIIPFQREVDYLGKLFEGVLRAGRGIEATLGTGVMDGSSWHGLKAIELGLADGIATREDVIAALSGSDPSSIELVTPEVFSDDSEDEGEEGIEATAVKPTENAPAENALPVTEIETPADEAGKPGETIMPQPLTVPRRGALALLASWMPGAVKPEPTAETEETATKILALETKISELSLLAADGEKARAEAIKMTFDAVIRATSPGSVTLEATTAKLQGKTLAEIEAEIAPFLAMADGNFAPQPGNPLAIGRGTLEPADDAGADEALPDAGEYNSDGTVKVKAGAETKEAMKARMTREYNARG